MLKYIIVSILFGASSAQICPSAEDMFPCTCSEEQTSISCDNVEGDFDIKGYFSNISSLLPDDIIFNDLSIVSNQGLFEIPAETITSLKFLRINIDDNGNLTHISPDAFPGTYSVTKILRLNNNPYLVHGLPYSERDVFDFLNKFTEVESLMAITLGIEVIPDNAFGPLLKLYDLNLGWNYIKKIGHSPFSQLSNLAFLIIRDNRLLAEGVSPTAFEGVSSQLDVDLVFNQIVHLPEESFKPLLDNALTVDVGGTFCNIFGCYPEYLKCDGSADWICDNQALYKPKLNGFLCEGFDIVPIWDYCNNATRSSL